MPATSIAIWSMVLATAMALVMPLGAAAESDGLSVGDLQRRVLELELRLDAQEEARDRQADAFSAAATRVEVVNGAVIGLITLAAVLAALLAIRWVRELAHRMIETQIEAAIDDKGREVFEAVSTELRREYDDKFTDLYRRFRRLVDDEDEEKGE